jgi:hypothetical protein
MHPPLLARVSAAVVLPLAAWSTPNRTEPRGPMLSANQDACFGRVDAAADLKNARSRG